MGVFLGFDAHAQLLLVRFEGDVTDEILVARFRQVREWFVRNGPRSNITDFSAVTGMNVGTQTVARMAAADPFVPNGFLRIIVAPQDEAFGMSRMYENLGSLTRDSVHVVRTMQEAIAIAGVLDPHFETIAEW